MTDKLIPSYVEADFTTMKQRLRDLLAKTDTFKDYNFEGANISILMELCAYVGDLNTYFTNKLAQNIHTETANVYEVVHSLVRQQGYEPSGYISPELVLTVRVNRTDGNGFDYFEQQDQLSIPQWFKFNTGITTAKGEPIYYCLSETFVYDVTEEDIENTYVEFDLTLKQGMPAPALAYTGEDIVGNQIVLPFKNYDMGNYPYEDYKPSIVVVVGDTEEVWERTSDFYDEISGLREVNNAYMLTYDKYKRYVLVFSYTRNIPTIDQSITVYLIESLGASGAVKAKTFDTVNGVGVKPVTDSINSVETAFLTNIKQSTVIPAAQYNIVNNLPSSGGGDPQSVEELKEAGKTSAHSQNRNVTKRDYIGNLEKRSDITKANVWGEQEQSPGALRPTNYNKAYISLVPTEWDTIEEADEATNVLLQSFPVTGEFVDNLPDKTLDFPIDYNDDWTNQILEYLEPRKMLGIWEEFILPELVYFRVDFGLKVKRAYTWTDVRETIKRKIDYYFLAENRSFGEVIDFREIYNYIIDPSQVSPTDDFALVRGIYSLVVRDVKVYRNGVSESISDQTHCERMGGTWTPPCSIDASINETYVYPDNIYNYFPHYVDTGYDATGDAVYNELSPIQLGYNQFPRLASDFCVYVNEG